MNKKLINVREIFPYYEPEELGNENARFIEAYELQVSPSNKDDITEAVHLYHELFESGCLEAGVNILCIVSRTLANIEDRSSVAVSILQEKFKNYVKELQERYDHNAYKYYIAISKICQLCRDENDSGNETGWQMMNELLEEGNGFAISFINYLVQSGANLDY